MALTDGISSCACRPHPCETASAGQPCLSLLLPETWHHCLGQRPAWGMTSLPSVQIPEEANSAVPLTGVSFSVAGQHLCAMAGPTLYVLDAFEGHVRPVPVAVAPALVMAKRPPMTKFFSAPSLHSKAPRSPVASPKCPCCRAAPVPGAARVHGGPAVLHTHARPAGLGQC